MHCPLHGFRPHDGSRCAALIDGEPCGFVLDPLGPIDGGEARTAERRAFCVETDPDDEMAAAA